MQALGKSFDYIIVDEAHHVEKAVNAVAKGIEMKGLPDGHNQTIARLSCKAFILASATLAQKNCTYSYSLERAITDGYLSDYEICAPIFDDTKGNTKKAIVALIKDTSAWSAVLAYCNDRKSGLEFEMMLREDGIPAAYMDGLTKDADRKLLKEQFEQGTLRALVTVYLF